VGGSGISRPGYEASQFDASRSRPTIREGLNGTRPLRSCWLVTGEAPYQSGGLRCLSSRLKPSFQLLLKPGRYPDRFDGRHRSVPEVSPNPKVLTGRKVQPPSTGSHCYLFDVAIYLNWLALLPPHVDATTGLREHSPVLNWALPLLLRRVPGSLGERNHA
jgi:hypothetical protein